jgi:uncharacterized membrane protein YsdA (DUF1294 family)/cold shock CspA family protein
MGAKFQGTLTNWNDDRGFGFIKPDGRGQDIFVNIKAFGRVSERPTNGAKLSFEVELGAEGKKRATRVEYIRSAAAIGQQRQPANRRRPASATSTGASWPVLALVSFAIFALLYAWATFRWGVHYYVLLGYLALSGWTYVMYMHDKTAAELGEWRVSEGGLHLLGLLGGWPGANLAQHFLRHKSKKTSFRVKHWVMVCLNLGVFAFMASNGMLILEYR